MYHVYGKEIYHGYGKENNIRNHPCYSRWGGYRVEGAINGVPTSFLLDTGATVTLLRRDTWANVTANHPQELKSWSTQRLVSADGLHLTIHGSVRVLADLG